MADHSNDSHDAHEADPFEALQVQSERAFKDIKILHDMLHEYIPFFAEMRQTASAKLLTDLPSSIDDYEETDQIHRDIALRSIIHRSDRAWCALIALHHAVIAAEGIMFICKAKPDDDPEDDFRKTYDPAPDDLGTPDDGCPF